MRQLRRAGRTGVARGAAALLLCAAACLGPARAASAQDDELARRTFANADQLMREGKVEQALREFGQVASLYPDSAVADDALYRMAQYYYPAETPEALGATSSTALQKAKEILTGITTKYPRGENAPRALLKLGLVALDPSNPERNLDEAYASFMSVVNIHPSSDVVDRALFGAGLADFLARRYDKSIGSFERAAEEHPDRPIAEDARFYMGQAYARLGLWLRALDELQEARDRFPEGRLAGRGLDLATRIYRMKVQPGASSRPILAHDPSFAPALDPASVRGPLALAVDADSVVHALDTRTGVPLRLGPDGKLISTGQPLEGAVSIAVGAGGVELLAASAALRSGVKPIEPRRQVEGESVPVEEITAAVDLGRGRLALLDSSSNEILLLAVDSGEIKTLFTDPEEKVRLTGLAAGAEGRLYTIDRRGRRVLEIDPDGRFRTVGSSTPAGPSFQEPAAIAADDIGDLFVLDRRSDTVTILTAEGKVLQTITSQPGAPSEFSEASAIAVGPRAELYLYDEKRRTILRFR